MAAGKCRETEASTQDGFQFLRQGDAMIDEEQAQEDKVLQWQYKAFRVADDICNCSKWEAAFSTAGADVWADQDRRVVEMECPELSVSNPTPVMGFSDVFHAELAMPTDGTPFWFSVRQTGNNPSKAITGQLPAIKLCLRRGVNIAPTITPSTMVFYHSTSTVKVSWEESLLNRTRCGVAQQAKLVYWPFGGAQVEKEPVNGENITLTDSTVANYTFALVMGTAQTTNQTVVKVINCNGDSVVRGELVL